MCASKYGYENFSWTLGAPYLLDKSSIFQQLHALYPARSGWDIWWWWKDIKSYDSKSTLRLFGVGTGHSLLFLQPKNNVTNLPFPCSTSRNKWMTFQNVNGSLIDMKKSTTNYMQFILSLVCGPSHLVREQNISFARNWQHSLDLLLSFERRISSPRYYMWLLFYCHAFCIWLRWFH